MAYKYKWNWDEEYLNTITDRALYPERYRYAEDIITLITNYIMDNYLARKYAYDTVWRLVSNSCGYYYGFTRHTMISYKKDIKKIIKEVLRGICGFH